MVERGMSRFFTLTLISLSSILIVAAILQNLIAQTQSTCGIQLGGNIHTQSDRQQYCNGSNDGQKAADNDFHNNTKFNDSPSPSTQQLHTPAYNEGYANSYDDEWNLLKNG
jgi:hypothetical protein